MGTELAPPGQVWVCAACGKRALSKYGFDDKGNSTSAQRRDESCMLHAVLCYEIPNADGSYQAVTP